MTLNLNGSELLNQAVNEIQAPTSNYPNYAAAITAAAGVTAAAAATANRNTYQAQPIPSHNQTQHVHQPSNQDVPYIPLVPLTNAFEVDFQARSNDVQLRPQYICSDNSARQSALEQQQQQKRDYFLQQSSVPALPRIAKKSSKHDLQPQQVNASTTSSQQVLNKCAERDRVMRSTLEELGQLTQSYDGIEENVPMLQANKNTTYSDYQAGEQAGQNYSGIYRPPAQIPTSGQAWPAVDQSRDSARGPAPPDLPRVGMNQQPANCDYGQQHSRQQQQQYYHNQLHQQQHLPAVPSQKSLAGKKHIKLADGPNLSEGQNLADDVQGQQQQEQQQKDQPLEEDDILNADNRPQSESTKESDRVKLKLKIPRPGMKRTKNSRLSAGGQLYEINIKKIESLEKQLEEIKLLFNKQSSEMENLQTSYSKLKEKEQIYIDLSRNAMNLLDVQHK